MYYTSKNCKVTLNNNTFIASDVQLNLQAQVQPIYLAGQRHSFNYSPNNGIQGALSLGYLLTGADYLVTLFDREKIQITGSIGGMVFTSGFLRSYGFSAEPNKPISVKAEIVFFDDLTGVFNPTYERVINSTPLLISDAVIIDFNNSVNGNLSGLTLLNYQYNANIEPTYKAGETTPYRINFKEKETIVNLQIETVSGILPVSGTEAGLRLSLGRPGLGALEVFTVSGKLVQRQLSTSNRDFLKNNITIRQNYIYNPPTVTSISVPSGPPLSQIILNGTNLDSVYLIIMDGQPVKFVGSGDGTISLTIPQGISATSNILIYTYGGSFEATGSFPVTQTALGISGLIPVTGAIGSSIKITGSNFYKISDVDFGRIPCENFIVVNKNIINATVPYNTAWDFVTVTSLTRNISGTSLMKFVPIPQIFGFSPTTGISGTQIMLTGIGFSGITGISFNNLNSGPFTVSNNTGINVQVPSGNVFGYIKVYGQSGVSALSLNQFTPLVNLTGIIPATGVTGANLELLGQNFYPELMYPADVGNSHFIASIGGATGMFFRINPGRLTGKVPANANSGFVYIYDKNFNFFPSSVTFTLLYGQPYISAVIPNSGKFGTSIVIQGNNLYQTTGIRFSGLINNTTTTGNVSSLGDSLSVVTPNISGGPYNILVYTSHGVATGQSGTAQGFYMLRNPSISGFVPTSGGVGTIVTLSGINIYPQSKIYFNNSGIDAEIVANSINGLYGRIQFKVPIGASGSNVILLNNSVSTVSGTTLFTLTSSPFISGFKPISGDWQSTITVSGKVLGSTTGVYIGNQIVTGFTVTSPTQFTFVIPTGLNSDYIYAYNQGGFGQSQLKLIILTPFVGITGLNPTSIRVGKTLIVSGDWLNTAREVLFTGEPISVTGFTTIGRTGLYVRVPENATTAPIIIKNPRGVTQSVQTLTILPNPIVNIVSPDFGVHNALIKISGENLTGMRFYFLSQNTGLWSGLVDAGNQIISGTTGASFTVPRNIVKGPIILSGDGNYYIGWTGNFVPLPTISGFRITGSQTGTIITLTGYNAAEINPLLFVTGINVTGNLDLTYVAYLTGNYFNITGSHVLNPTTGFALLSGTINTNFGGFGKLALVSNAFTGISDGPTLLASNADDYLSQTASSNQYFFGWLPPVITGFGPIRGSTPTLVSISGVDLRVITGIYINNNLGTIVERITGINFDILRFLPPAGTLGTSGRFTGVSLFGKPISTDFFTYISAPDISGFIPTKGILATNVRITGEHFQFVSGVYFGDFLATHTVSLEGDTYVVTGVVPDVTYSLPRNVLISLRNEAGLGQAGNFTVYQSGAIIKYRTSDSDLKSIPVSNGVLNFTHGLGYMPDSAQIVLVNRTAELGYSVDDEVTLSETTTESVFGAMPYIITKDVTNVSLVHNFGTYPRIEIFNKSNGIQVTGGINTGNWRLRAIATYQFDS